MAYCRLCEAIPVAMSGDPSNSRLERSGWADRSAEPIDREITPPSEVQAYYAGFPGESRLELGAFRLEFERTKEILARVLPTAPARIIDVGISSTSRRGSCEIARHVGLMIRPTPLLR